MAGLCGFVGFEGCPVPSAPLRAMAEAAIHRGPDGLRYEILEEGAFAHLALHATAETARESQPLLSPEGPVCLVADLRLDNCAELLQELEPRGLLSRGRKSGDAEILLGAYLLWGERCVQHLLGDFAFALWDRRARRLLCARDPLGVKPLHYARAGALVLFASEAQQLLRHPAVPRRLDELSLAFHLAGWPPAPGRSFFEDVHRLPAAHLLVATPAGDRLVRYWDPGDGSGDAALPSAERSAALLDVLQRSVTDRLRTGGSTVGIALSGGLDSTTVAALARRSMGSPGAPGLLGCSFVFETLRECDERPYIQALVEDTGIEVAYVDAESHWLLSDRELYTPPLEAPFLSWQSCHEQMLRTLRRRGARVLLTGHGADDLFRGSPLVFLDRVCRGDLTAITELARTARSQGRKVSGSVYHHLLRPLLPASLIRALHGTAALDTAPDLPPWIAAPFARRTDLDRRLRARRTPGLPGRRASREIREVALEIAAYERVVDWYDRNAARAGVEVRHPFLDRRVFDLVLALHPEQLYSPGSYKPLLRRAMAGILPDALRLRTTKTSLGRFINFSLADRAAGVVEELLREPLCSDLGLVDGAKLREAYRRYRRGEPGRAQGALWFAITLEIWLRRHFSLQAPLHSRAEALAQRPVSC